MSLFDFELKKNLPIPLYYQLKQGLMEMMDKGTLVPGTLLPSEREFSEMFDISRMTVRQAINELEQEGHVYRVRGKGTFIAEKKVQQKLSRIMSFSAMMRNQGFVPSSYVHQTKVMSASPIIKEALELAQNDEVLMIERIRLADERPMVIERTYLPLQPFQHLNPNDLKDHSLYDLLFEKYGLNPTRAVETIEAELAGEHEAEFLGMNKNMPVLVLKQVTYDQFGKPFEYVHATYRGDRYKLVVDSEE